MERRHHLAISQADYFNNSLFSLIQVVTILLIDLGGFWLTRGVR